MKVDLVANHKPPMGIAAFYGGRVQNPGAMARDSIERMSAPFRAIEHVYPPFGAIEESVWSAKSLDRAITARRDAFQNADALMKTLETIDRVGAPFSAFERSFETFRFAERMTAPIREMATRSENADPDVLRVMRNALAHGVPLDTVNYDILFEQHTELPKEKPVLAVGSVIVPEKPVAEGVLVKCTSLVWASVVSELQADWRQAFEIPPRVWEEIIAGAFKEAKFDEVILTPRSGDHGRDVIAVRNGVGSIRILGSVKAYKPGHLITKEEVHALMGVVALDHNASKGIFATTSDFAPLILNDPGLAASVPHRIELMNGRQLQLWLRSLLDPT